jgi:site-specific recombinase XerD
MYGTGMRVSEAVHLRAADIDSQRMMIRIELGKGHKGRDVQLSPSYWSCCAAIGGKYGRGNGCSREKFPTNL